jgi:hypothetical protein
MDKEQIEKYFRRNEELENERIQWESQWQEIQDFVLTGQGFFIRSGQQPNQGEKRGIKIVDGTATRAMRIFAAGMQGGLTSPSRPWFRLTLSDPQMTEISSVREWLEYVERAMYRVFARSNFYTTVMSLYTDIGGFGTSAVYEEENQRQEIGRAHV